MLLGGAIRVIWIRRRLKTIQAVENDRIRASSMIPTLITNYDEKYDLIRQLWRTYVLPFFSPFA